MSDMKLFMVIGLLALGVFGTYRWIGSTKVPYREPPARPSITIVSPGTPGVKTFVEQQQEQREQQRSRR